MKRAGDSAFVCEVTNPQDCGGEGGGGDGSVPTNPDGSVDYSAAAEVHNPTLDALYRSDVRHVTFTGTMYYRGSGGKITTYPLITGHEWRIPIDAQPAATEFPASAINFTHVVHQGHVYIPTKILCGIYTRGTAVYESWWIKDGYKYGVQSPMLGINDPKRLGDTCNPPTVVLQPSSVVEAFTPICVGASQLYSGTGGVASKRWTRNGNEVSTGDVWCGELTPGIYGFTLTVTNVVGQAGSGYTTVEAGTREVVSDGGGGGNEKCYTVWIVRREAETGRELSRYQIGRYCEEGFEPW